MRVAAYQAPLLPCGSMEAVELIRRRVEQCEAEGVEILCCPEAVLGGLVDYAPCPAEIAMDMESGQLNAVLKPLASDSVTTIVDFTEVSGSGHLYNSAAVFHKGAVVGYSNHPEPARIMASQGATALFVPTNNGLPPDRADVVAHARSVDIARAMENNVSIIRADVAGRSADLVSYGSSGIIAPNGTILQSAQRLTEDLLFADIEVRSGDP